MLLALAIVASFGTVGNLLVFAFLIAPPATATLLVRRVPAIMVVGVLLGASAGTVGLLISYHHSTAAGATMALCTVVVFFTALIARSVVLLVQRQPTASGPPDEIGSAGTLRDMADDRLQGTEIADSVIDLIGHTPLVRMKRMMEVEQIPSVLAMKMETTNPGGSSKDRPALEMILAAEREGPAAARAARSSSRPAATPASGWPSSPPSAATAACS